MNLTVAALRFLFGAVAGLVLVAAFAVFGLLPLWLAVAGPVATGVLAIAFGDRFLLAFMRIFRWLQ